VVFFEANTNPQFVHFRVAAPLVVWHFGHSFLPLPGPLPAVESVSVAGVPGVLAGVPSDVAFFLVAIVFLLGKVDGGGKIAEESLPPKPAAGKVGVE
jgi:hypothetical protein